jgi:hypothetical protein
MPTERFAMRHVRDVIRLSRFEFASPYRLAQKSTRNARSSGCPLDSMPLAAQY